MASQSRRQKRQMLKSLGLLGNANKTALQKQQAKQIMDLLSNIDTNVSENELQEVVIEEKESDINSEMEQKDETDGTK